MVATFFIEYIATIYDWPWNMHEAYNITDNLR